MSTQPTDTAPRATNGRRRRLLRLLALVVLVVAVAWTAWYLLDGRWHESTEDAYVQGNVVQITPQTAGTVVSITADDGDLIEAGQTLVVLDPTDAEVAVARAEANLAGAVRKVRGLYNAVDSGRASVAAQKVALDKARADYARRKDLAASGAISAEELAHARDALAAAESALAVSQQQLATSRALVDDTVVASHPDVQAAAAALRSAYLDRARTTLVAPVTGHVAKRSVQVGQRVQPGSPLMAVVPLDEVWVEANFKETQLRHMRIGQPVKLRSDLYGSEAAFSGRIESLGVGTGSAFALLPAQNATGNWIKIVQRVPVRIAFASRDVAAHPLRIGLSMHAEVDLHDQSGAVLATQPPRAPVLSTDVYARQLGDAEARIAAIVHANVAAAPADAKP